MRPIPSLPIFQARTMEELKALGFWQHRLFGAMFSIFGAVALMLASVGVYGMLSYSVSQRTQEIGVRMALGANRRDVLQLVVGHGLKLAGIGVRVWRRGCDRSGATDPIRPLQRHRHRSGEPHRRLLLPGR